MKKNNFRSIEVLDNTGAKWRYYGNSIQSVFQKKIGRSWATWNSLAPSEVINKIENLTSKDFVACR